MSVRTVDVKASTIEEAFEQAGLNWVVEQSEMLNIATGKMVEGKKVLYRSDNKNQLGVVGINYGVIQNTDCFAFFDIICKQNKASICKVHEYNGGVTIHLEAEVRDKTFEARVGDEVGFRFNLWNDFSGVRKASVMFGALRLICSNGLVALDQKDSIIEIRHTKNALTRFDQAIKVWSSGEKWYTIFKENVKILVNKMVTQKQVEDFLNNLFGNSNSGVNTRRKEKIIHLFENGKGNGKGTAWDLLNGVTEYIDHFSKKEKDESFEYANIGAGHNVKLRAFELAMNL